MSESHKSSLPGFLGVIDSLASRFESFVLIASILCMALITIINIIGRVTWGSLFFVEELNRILIIFITFSGLSYAARQGRHVRMTAFYDVLSAKYKKILMVIICLLTSICMFAFSYFTVIYLQKLIATGRISPALGIPIWSIYLWVPIGFIVTGLQYLLTAIKNLLSKKIYISTNIIDGYQEEDLSP